MTELIYGPNDLWEFIKKKYPKAIYTDASDDIHRERFELELPGTKEDEFYPWAIVNGFAGNCFKLQLKALDPLGMEHHKIERWTAKAKKLKPEAIDE